MSPQALSDYLLNAAWQAPLAALVALLVTQFAGLAPAARYRVWLAALATAVVLPAVALDLPRLGPTVTPITPTTVVEAAAAAAPPSPAAIGAGTEAPVLALAPWTAWAMVGLAGAFALLLAARLTVACVAARRLAATGRPVQLPTEAARAVEALAAAHHRRPPPVLATPAIDGPAVVGALRPLILIPAHLDASPEDLRAALLHETAHVLRHDYAVNLACELLTLPVAWHPAVAAIKAGARRSRELACDALAAQAMDSRKAYANALLSLARRLGAGQAAPRPTHTQAALAVGLFGRGDLEDRLMHLMNTRDPENGLVRAARAASLAVVSASLLAAAALLHVTPVFAQPAKAAPAAASVPATPLPPAEPAPPTAASPPAPPAAVQAAREAEADAARPHRRQGVVIHKDGVLIEAGQTGHRHSWTAADGRTMSVVNDEAAEPTAEQKRRWEADARDAEARAAKVEAYVRSPEFKARIERAKEAGKRAEAMVNSPEFKARIRKATEEAAKAEAYANSAEFKARIEKARAAGAAARAYVNSPEFKAAIASAEAEARAAAAFTNSPEFRRQMEDLRRDFEDPARDPS